MKTTTFEDLDLSHALMKAVEDLGFEETTPIQAKAITHIMEGEDVIGQAQTGTGKTAAFGIPILEKINPKERRPQALILCPTRELAIQVAEELKRLATYKKRIHTIPIYGGQPIERQIRSLKKGVHVVIGTPGRIMDHLRRKTLVLNHIKTIVLDEADVMLDMGFIQDIETILADVPQERQTLFFSATIPQPILDLREKYQRDSKFIKVVHKELTVPEVKQYYFEVKRGTKLDVLTRLLDMHSPKLSLIFCNTRKKVEELNSQLQTRGYLSDALHGLMKQSQRDRVMDKFRNGLMEIMVATDVAARGIDVDDVEIVFNYDVPQDIEYYIHRIGRTARVGRSGKAFTFVVGKDIYKVRDIQRFAKTRIVRQQVPSLHDVEDVKMEQILEELTSDLQGEKLGKYIKMIEKLLEHDYTPIEVAAALLKRSIHKNGYEEERDDYTNTGAEPGMARLFINVGKKEKINPGHIVGAIAGETGLPGKLIGAIDVYDKFTFVEVPRERASEVLEIMKNNYIKGNKIHVEPARARSSS